MKNNKRNEFIHQAKKRTDIKPKELNWFEKCMDEGLFEMRAGKDDNFYLHYNLLILTYLKQLYQQQRF